MSWTGNISASITFNFDFEVGEDWNAEDIERAKAMVTDEVADYLGSSYLSVEGIKLEVTP